MKKIFIALAFFGVVLASGIGYLTLKSGLQAKRPLREPHELPEAGWGTNPDLCKNQPYLGYWAKPGDRWRGQTDIEAKAFEEMFVHILHSMPYEPSTMERLRQSLFGIVPRPDRGSITSFRSELLKIEFNRANGEHKTTIQSLSKGNDPRYFRELNINEPGSRVLISPWITVVQNLSSCRITIFVPVNDRQIIYDQASLAAGRQPGKDWLIEDSEWIDKIEAIGADINKRMASAGFNPVQETAAAKKQFWQKMAPELQQKYDFDLIWFAKLLFQKRPELLVTDKPPYHNDMRDAAMDEILPKHTILVKRLFDSVFSADLRGQKAERKKIDSILDLKGIVPLEEIKVELEDY
jgi:hypothetical protein